MEKPKLIEPEKIDLERLKKICQDYIDFVDSENFHEDNDFNHYITEVALETYFGVEVWNFINNRQK